MPTWKRICASIKGLMAPEEVARGLSLRAIELVAQQEPRRYAYRIVVQQEARKHELLKGTLSVEVVGVLAVREVNYPLVELSDELTDELLVLRFRYFQAIEGVYDAPEGFVPRMSGLWPVSVHRRKSKPGSSTPGNYRRVSPMLGSKKSSFGVSGSTTLISADTVVVGDLHFSGNLDIEGLVQGNIVALPGKDALVRVVGKGRVEGEIHAALGHH